MNSCWWKAGISGENGHKCDNFREFVKCYPDIALQVLDKCITRSDESNSVVTYDFKPYEDCYYIPTDTRCFALDPYDIETHRLLPNAYEHHQNSLEWKNNHPLNLMISNQRHKMLHHPLTKMWLLQKWKSYIYVIFLGVIFIEILFALCLTSFMAMVENWHHIKEKWNFTKQEFCNFSSQEISLPVGDLQQRNESGLEESSSSISTGFTDCTKFIVLKQTVWVALLILTLTTIFMELYSFYRLKKQYLSYMEHKIRILRTLFTIVVLIPDDFCSFCYIILNVEKWQCGVLAFLLTWLHLISTLNQLPMFSIFMPVTSSFMKSFFKVLLYIFMIMFIFAFIFHLTLYNQTAFQTLPQAMAKTTMWMLGDLAYDNTFVFNDSELLYPALIKALFLVFVAFLGGFVINFIITQPASKLDNFREKAFFHREASRAELFLKLDICFPTFRKYKTRGRFTDNEARKDEYTSCIRKLLLLDNTKKTQPISQIDLLQGQLDKQNIQITELVSLHKEHIEEMKEIKNQLTFITNSLTATKTPV